MSLQPNSQPEARSLVLFLLLWHNYWFSRQDPRPPAPWTWSKGSRFGLRAHVQAKLGSHFQHQLSKLRHHERNESCARLPVVRAPFKLDFKIRALSCWFIKTTLLPPANKGSLSFLSLQNICCKLLHHSPSLLLTAVIERRHKMKLPSPCGARIWKPFSCFLCFEQIFRVNFCN